MLRKIVDYILLPFFFVGKKCFQVLDYLITKDSSLVVFASKSGKTEDCNIKTPWELIKENPKWKAYLVSTKPENSNQINIYSLKGLWIILRAKYVYISHGPNDIFYAHYSSRKIVTYVGHGVPLKSFIFTNKNLSYKELFKQKLEVPTYSYIIASSDKDKENLSRCFNVTEEKVIISGLPRNDYLYKSNNTLKEKFSEETFILYAPTFRDDGDIEFFPFSDKNLIELNRWLERNNARLFVRGHINNSDNNITELSQVTNFSTDKYPDIQPHLASFNCLVTDYSSIYIDYLLLERPVAFIPYDLEVYKERRGLLYSFEDVTPGPQIKTQFEFVQFLDQVIKNEFPFQEKLIDCKKTFHKYTDNFSQRMLEMTLKGKLHE